MDDEVRLIAVHPALWPAIEQWAEEHNLLLGRIPGSDEDGLPTYVFSPKVLGE